MSKVPHVFAHHEHYARIIEPIYGNESVGNSSPAAGDVYLRPFQIPFTMTLSAAMFWCQVSAPGNVIQGIYADNGDTPQGGAVLAETLSTALVALRVNEVAYVAAARLTPGLYWTALESDNVTNSLGRINPLTLLEDDAVLLHYSYSRVAGYGALTDPCPVVASYNAAPYMQQMRVSSVP